MSMLRENKKVAENAGLDSRGNSDGRIRFGVIVFVLLLIVISVSLIRLKKEPTPESQYNNADLPKVNAAVEKKIFHGAYAEWENEPIDIYVTNFVMDNEVLISLKNCSNEKQITIERIGICFIGDDEKIIDQGAMEIDRAIDSYEKTGFISFKTENMGRMDRKLKNKRTLALKIDISVKEKLSRKVTI